jgi:Na+/H+-dicarboxylate symporter
MVLNQLGMPLEGIAIILAVDRIVDMMRTVVNITGDAVVTTIVGQRVGKLDRAVFDDAQAGVIDPSRLEIDHAAERAFESITHKQSTA